MPTEHSDDRNYLRNDERFREMPQRMQAWILESDHAASDFAAFFRNGGDIVSDTRTHLPYYHPTEPPKIVVDEAAYSGLKGAPQSSTILAELSIFTTLAHEIGHDKYNTATMPFRGGSAEDYVKYRSDIEARTVFNAFPIFRDLKGNDDFRTINWKFIGYSTGSGMGAAVVYASWKEGKIDDRAAVAQLSAPIPNFPYTRGEGLSDQNDDGSLTQRDLYLRDYQRLIKQHPDLQQPPSTGRQTLSDFSDPTHPGHTAFARTLSEVRRMEESHAIPSGPDGQVIAAALVVEAERQKMTITNVELRSDGLVHGIERRNAFEPERQVGLHPDAALRRSMAGYATDWLELRSPHLIDASVAARPLCMDHVAGRFAPDDNALLAKIKHHAPAHFPDETIAHAMLEAKRCGLNTADQVGGVAMVGDKMQVYGTTPGYVAVVDLTRPVPNLDQTSRQAEEFNLQRDASLAMQLKPGGMDDPGRNGPSR